MIKTFEFILIHLILESHIVLQMRAAMRKARIEALGRLMTVQGDLQAAFFKHG